MNSHFENQIKINKKVDINSRELYDSSGIGVEIKVGSRVRIKIEGQRGHGQLHLIDTRATKVKVLITGLPVEEIR